MSLAGTIEFSSDEPASTADDNSSDASGAAPRRTSLTLDGSEFKFENPVSLVLAAARQLGMNVRLHVSLLWIADEALMDEFDEDQAAALDKVPAVPLSEDVAAYYGDTFRQRSRAIKIPLNDDTAERPPIEAVPRRSPTSSKRSPTMGKSKRELKRERRRRSLALREERLSRVSERATEENAVLSESELALVRSGQLSPHSPRAAVWPGDLKHQPSSGSMRRMPRIDSSSVALDQLDTGSGSEPAAAGASSPAAAPSPPSPVCEVPLCVLPQSATAAAASSAVAAAGAAAAVGGAAGAGSSQDDATEAAPAAAAPAAAAPPVGSDDDAPPSRQYTVGQRVQVDFDDEGWFGGLVASRRRDLSGGLVYQVQLDDGEFADDVEGSEIRSELTRAEAAARAAAAAAAGGGSDQGSKASGSRENPGTRADSLSVFELDLQCAPPSEASQDEEPSPSMHGRVTGSGEIEWSFIDESQLPTWSPPTAALLRAHDSQFPRWQDVVVDASLKPV